MEVRGGNLKCFNGEIFCLMNLGWIFGEFFDTFLCNFLNCLMSNFNNGPQSWEKMFRNTFKISKE